MHTPHDSKLEKFSLDSNYFLKVRLRDGRRVDVKGKGDVIMQTPVGTNVISEVLYVLELNQNLFSIGQLLDKNYMLYLRIKLVKLLIFLV